MIPQLASPREKRIAGVVGSRLVTAGEPAHYRLID
jgi:hypothetical protein